MGVHIARAGLDPPLVPCAPTRCIRPDVDREEFGNVLINPCGIERVPMRTYGEGEDVGTVSSEGLELGAGDRTQNVTIPRESPDTMAPSLGEWSLNIQDTANCTCYSRRHPHSPN